MRTGAGRRRLDPYRGQIAALHFERIDFGAEAGAVFERHLQKRRLDLGHGVVLFLIAAHLQTRELLEHFFKGQLYSHRFRRSDRAQENLRHLLKNRGE